MTVTAPPANPVIRVDMVGFERDDSAADRHRQRIAHGPNHDVTAIERERDDFNRGHCPLGVDDPADTRSCHQPKALVSRHVL
jgi:hypothetical protein